MDAVRQSSTVRWGAAVNIVVAWIVTLPVAADLGFVLCPGLRAVVTARQHRYESSGGK